MFPRRSLYLFVLSALTALCSGCSGVRVRSDGTPLPQDCPREALESMAEMGIGPSESIESMSVIVDERWGESGKTPLVEGPVVGYLYEPYRQLPRRTRLFGQVWTGGEMVIVRYDALQVPGGRRRPFCAEVDDSGGQEKDPASPRGVAIIPDNVAAVRLVARYGEIDPSRPPGRLYIYRDINDLPPKVRERLKK